MKKKHSIVNERIGRLINKLNWGQFVVGKIQFVFVLITMLGVFKIPAKVCVIVSIPALAIVYIIGHFFDKYWRKPYLDAHYKDVDLK